MSSNRNFDFRTVRSSRAEMEFRHALTSSSDNNWRWARRLESNERLAEAKIRKEEDAAIKAIERNG
jgi:hypothetical protein